MENAYTSKFNNTDGNRVSLRGIAAFFNVSFIFFVIILPSGSLFGINIKLLSIAALVAFNILVIVSRGRVSSSSLKCFIVTIIALAFIATSYVISTSAGNSASNIKNETMLFASFFIPCFFLYTSINEKIISKELVVKTILYTSTAYSIIKIGFVTASAIGLLPIYVISDYIAETTGIYPMLFPITDSITRFQLANDFIICFAVFFLICKKEYFSFIGKKTLNVIFIILTLSVLVSFSRYMLIVLFVAFAIRMLSIRRINKTGLVISFLMFIALSVVAVLYSQQISDAVDKRFNSSATASSDATRKLQIDCLTASSVEAPMFGHGGMGAYDKTCPGPPGYEFSYEVQYLGFTYRFGFLLTAFILMVYVSQFTVSVTDRLLSLRNAPVLCGLSLWMCIGAFNPYLTSGYAAVIMMLFLCLTESKDY